MTLAQLEVRVAGAMVGTLSFEDYVYSFVYRDPTSLDPERDLVSLTMPVRARAYETQVMPPPFQSVLPEGELLNRLRARYGKVIAVDDDFELLRLVGPHTIGRVTFGDPTNAISDDTVADLDLAGILRHRDAEQLFLDLVQKYGLRFGVGGIQPKALHGGIEQRVVVPTDALLIKLAGRDFPQLPVNEHYCLQASRAAEIPTAESFLADNHDLIAVRRFDRTDKGAPRAFEEISALLRLSRHGKYDRSYEEIARVIRQIPCHNAPAVLRDFFAMVVLTMTLRNGDGHLRNFGILYDTTDRVELAPAYDLVTTTVYLARDQPALELAGRKQWPDRATLERFGLESCEMRSAGVRKVIERVANAVAETHEGLKEFGRQNPTHRPLCEKMAEQWSEGLGTLTKG